MKRGTITKVATILLGLVLLLASTGCNRLLYATNAVSTATGWLFGGLATASNAEYQCYQNGVLIDCADLPSDLGQ